MPVRPRTPPPYMYDGSKSSLQQYREDDTESLYDQYDIVIHYHYPQRPEKSKLRPEESAEADYHHPPQRPEKSKLRLTKSAEATAELQMHIREIEMEHTLDVNPLLQPEQEFMPFRQFILVFIGLALAMFTASLCATIVTVTMGKMAADMNDAVNMAWIPTSYMLTSTAFSPIWGNLSDVFGRKIVLITAVLIFMTGSFLCAMSNTMVFLIISRAIQGIGGGAVVSLVSIVIADLVPLRDSPKYQGLIGGVFSLSSVLGPILGGVFVDQATWRWAFWTQLPIGLFAILSFLFFLKSGTKKVGSSWDKLARIDYWGILCLLITIVTLLLGMSWGGQVYPWKSAPIISLFIISGIFIGLTVFVEMRVAREPICPPSLFVQRNLLSLYCGSFFTGFSFYAVLFYLPVFYQKTQLESATASGLEMLPIILGLSIFSVISGSLVSWSGRFRIFIWIGMFLLTLGAALISTLVPSSPKAMQICYLLITGCGVGLALQTLIVAGQASVQRKDLAAVTSLLTFWRTIGGVLGTALCGTIYQNALQSNLSTMLSPEAFARIVSKSGADFSKASPGEVSSVINAYAVSLQLVYRTFVGFAALALFATLFLQHKELGFGAKTEAKKVNKIEPFEMVERPPREVERPPREVKRQSQLKMEREMERIERERIERGRM